MLLSYEQNSKNGPKQTHKQNRMIKSRSNVHHTTLLLRFLSRPTCRGGGWSHWCHCLLMVKSHVSTSKQLLQKMRGAEGREGNTSAPLTVGGDSRARSQLLRCCPPPPPDRPQINEGSSFSNTMNLQRKLTTNGCFRRIILADVSTACHF